MEGKKYLYMPDLPREAERFEKVMAAFMRKAFFTNSTLFIVMDGTKFESSIYPTTMYTLLCGGGVLTITFSSKEHFLLKIS